MTGARSGGMLRDGRMAGGAAENAWGTGAWRGELRVLWLGGLGYRP